MKHFYQNISGMFLPEQKLCYKNQIRQAKENSHFVELGIWKGRSASFMAVEIINSGKKIKYDVVDTWLGTPSLGTKEYSRSPLVKNGTLYEHFLDNIKQKKHIFQRYLSRAKLKSKFTPKINFFIDDTFDEAEKIEKLLLDKKVQRDLNE